MQSDIRRPSPLLFHLYIRISLSLFCFLDTVFPRIISLSALSFNTFNIQWVYLGNAALDYTIDIKLASSPAEQPWTTLLQRSYNALTDVNITYGDLMPYTLYEVRVIVRLYTRFDPILGFVPDERLIPGVSQLFRTRADVPEDSPRNVRVVGKTGESNSDIVVSWEVSTINYSCDRESSIIPLVTNQ